MQRLNERRSSHSGCSVGNNLLVITGVQSFGPAAKSGRMKGKLYSIELLRLRVDHTQRRVTWAAEWQILDINVGKSLWEYEAIFEACSEEQLLIFGSENSFIIDVRDVEQSSSHVKASQSGMPHIRIRRGSNCIRRGLGNIICFADVKGQGSHLVEYCAAENRVKTLFVSQTGLKFWP